MFPSRTPLGLSLTLLLALVTAGLPAPKNCLPQDGLLSPPALAPPTYRLETGLPGSAAEVAATDVARPQGGTPAQSAAASVEYLARVMDQFHNRFPVYDDVSSAGNHFHAFAKIEDENAPVEVNGSWPTNPHGGATAIRFELRAGGAPFGGFYFQNGVLPAGQTAPQVNFGTVPDAGIDLTGATSLTFWARGERGGEKVEFFVGGVGRDADTGAPTAPFPDSSPRRPPRGMLFDLSTGWKKFTIDLAGADLSYVLGGFAWVASLADNTSGAVFYVDDIQYELGAARLSQRLNEPRFVRSYTTEPFQSRPPPVGDFDLVLRNSAFTYDNALALLAFLADGSADSLRRARLLGDAFVYASQHDRTFDDGRLRSDYAAGDIALPPGWTPNNRRGTVPTPGFYVEGQGFVEIEQGAIDTGNNAWAMVALLALHRRTSSQVYLETARKLGNFIRTFRNDAGTFKGFQGGIEAPEGTPSRRAYASTEHNLDVYAAFLAMYEVTGERQWLADAQHARRFVEDMFDGQKGCYLTGTLNPEARNAIVGQLPLDVQAWAVIALPDALALHPQLLACSETYHRNAHDGFTAFDFNDDKDGVWFEGSAQMATAYAFAGQAAATEGVRQELRRAQQAAPFGGGGGIVASCHDGLSTGFNFSYFRRLHAGATAWNVFAQLGFNPYYQVPDRAVHFGQEGYNVGEGAGSIQITVTRSGDVSGPASVGYQTQGGTASDRADYTAALGTLRFAAGERDKTFKVFITDDVSVEGLETVSIKLGDAAGTSVLGLPRTAVLNITDNDAPPPLPNPIDDPQFFVRQHYVDFLNREPDPSGLAFWIGQITECETRPEAERQGCREVRRINVSAAFFLSIEFQQTGYLVYRTYQASFDAGPRLEIRSFLQDTQEIGRDIIVGEGDWQQRLEQNRLAFLDDFVARPLFLAQFPANISAPQYVDALNANTGMSLSPAERDLLVAGLSGGTQTRASVLRTVVEDPDFRAREFNRAFVLMQYFGYLRRNPDDPPDANFDGYNFWLAKLQQFGGNFFAAEMVKAFITSGEYQQRFKP